MSLKTLAADGVIKKTDKYRVPLAAIEVVAGFNMRLLAKKSNATHIESIYHTLRAQLTAPGALDGNRQLAKGKRLLVHDVEVQVEDGDRLTLLDGHCSREALMRLVREGVIGTDFLVDIAYFKGTPAEAKKKMLLCGASKELEPLEIGLGFKSLRDEDGYTPEQIVAELGRSIVSVRDLLKLADADPAIHRLIEDEKVAAHTAITYIKEYGAEALEFLTMGVGEAAGRGKKTFTTGIAEGRALPKKVWQGLVSVTDNLTSSLNHETRRQIAELENLPEEQLKGKTVAIDAKVMIELLAAHNRIAEEREKQKTKSANAEQAAKQADLVAAE